MVDETITKKSINIEKILVMQKWEVAKRIKAWRERNKKYFKDWDIVKAIRVLRKKNGRP
jgi:radical SAM superfamily enzyme with C-terminal helix-hairpin-helix motif